MAITTQMIKKLRDNTGAGMMDCKRALEETGGDMDAAVEFLRKKGALVAAKRADRAAKEGMVVTRVSSSGKTGVIVEVNCETDFVGRSEDFAAFAQAVAAILEQHTPATMEALMGLEGPGGRTLAAMQNDLLAKVGEKIDVRRFRVLQGGDSLLSAYTHMGSKIGVLVEVTGMTQAEAISGTGRDMAMQVAAMNPMVVSREELGKPVIERELDIYRTQAKNEGKPDKMLDKIAAGRLEKFYQEVVLTEQLFIKDSAKTVHEVLQGVGASVKQFVRYHLGEENT